MNQYWWLFGVARVPEDDGGRIRLDADAKHIVVLCRGQIYRLDVLGEDNRIIDELDLATSLQSILNDAHRISSEEASQTAVGLLTTENQKFWSRCRKALVHEGLKNGSNLGSIDSSLFALCLDDSNPEAEADMCKNMICGTNIAEAGVQIGTCLNRWYDKLAIIVCSNGAAGMNFEHTCSDGSVDIRMACDIYKGSISPSEKGTGTSNGPPLDPTHKLQNGSSKNCVSPFKCQKLEWDIPPEISEALRIAEERLIERIERHQLETLDIKDYGSTFIKSAGFSPDAFFQMALQAAYCSTYKQIRSGFEPDVTRQYLHGRTDVARTTTAEAAAFARIFSDEKASTNEKIEAMRRAAEAHVALSKSCAKGNSHHRHLYVLHQLWKRRRAFLEAAALGPPPSVNGHDDGQKDTSDNTIFTDPGWSRLGTTILLGSNVDNPHGSPFVTILERITWR